MSFDDALTIGLQVAVPLRIAELKHMTPHRRQTTMEIWRTDAVDAVASRGDALQFGGKKGAAAAVFNDLARGLAVLAHAPGGVLFAGMHWCLEHSRGTTAETDLACTTGWVPPPGSPKRHTETLAVEVLQ